MLCGGTVLLLHEPVLTRSCVLGWRSGTPSHALSTPRSTAAAGRARASPQQRLCQRLSVSDTLLPAPPVDPTFLCFAWK